MATLNFSLSHPDALSASPVSNGDLSEVAYGPCPVNLSNALAGRPVDLWKMKCLAPALWAQMVKDGTQDSVHAAYLLSVDEKTGRNYIAGSHSPQWPVVAAVLKDLPPQARYAAVDYLIGAA